MELGMVGLGRMGSNIRRPMRAGHHCVVYDFHPEAIPVINKDGATGATSIEDFASKLQSPRTGRESDSGEGRWTIAAAIDESVPAPVISAALYQRFSFRGEADFGDKVQSALRYRFGRYEGKPTTEADA